MNTPICDFLQRYKDSGTVRMHMPGHKGAENPFDITEIAGADSLYEAGGIIKESEQNASRLFGCHTFYSTEGSSHAIRAMLWLCLQYAKARGSEPLILAGRNAHRAFISAATLCECEVEWLYPENGGYLSCNITGERLDNVLKGMPSLPTAVYLTSPDYLGNILDIKSLSEVCRKYGVLLLLDNAHGAYLRFLENSIHPMDLGADMCCDSAHKTLPVLTGGAYLHISSSAPRGFVEHAKDALLLFGSTSPSYLVLSSLDRANGMLENYREPLAKFIKKVDRLKAALRNHGYTLLGTEPLKITIYALKFGYKGTYIADVLRKNGIECEFADRDTLVLMLSPVLTDEELNRVEKILCAIESEDYIDQTPPPSPPPIKRLSLKAAALAPSERVGVESSVGRVAALAAVSCPPAVDIVVPGEEITAEAVRLMRYYGIENCSVIK